jgi:hypothetical protein
LLRNQGTSTVRKNPLNKGLLADFEAACAQELLQSEAKETGLLFWLGRCQILMTNLIERKTGPEDSNMRIKSMIVLGLSGLGISRDKARELANIK